jgi:hypothetical protein
MEIGLKCHRLTTELRDLILFGRGSGAGRWPWSRQLDHCVKHTHAHLATRRGGRGARICPSPGLAARQARGLEVKFLGDRALQSFEKSAK